MEYITVDWLTSGGGKVISGNKNFLVAGKAIGCLGDEAICPLHNTIASIITGDPTYHIGGRPIARTVDLLSYGCSISPSPNK
ncbi:PAAR domain-containing protein [Acinetobacter courvalinii]|uniref:PAAR domain-containing protein n=1 Tax=Acinetobacter courvalinii TaxID=280147 RepID=UPI00289D4D0D|nr:PAAR domain-containing protein [Acinetobacter courvalinii]